MSTTDRLEEKRKFLVGAGARESQELYGRLIGEHIQKASVVVASDGVNVLQKFANDPAHVVLLEMNLPKMTGLEAAEQLLVSAKNPVAVILLAPIPDQEHFVDEVAVGRVQFVDPAHLSERIGGALARALNSINDGKDLEFHVRFLSNGDQLMKCGEKADSVYIVVRGSLTAWVPSAEGKDVILGKIEPSEFVGEMAYLSGGTRSANVVATSDCELIEIPISHLDRLLFEKPSWARALMKTLAKRVQNANIRRQKSGPLVG